MEQSTFFQASDGWLFSTMLSFHRRKLSLSKLIVLGNLLNHCIFTLDQINDGLSRLESEGYISFEDKRVFLTPKAKEFHTANKKRFEPCIAQQVRYSEIFSKMKLEKETNQKRFFTQDEYLLAIEKC